MTGRFSPLLRYLPFLYRLLFVLAAVPAWIKFRHYFVSDAIAQLAIAEHIREGHFALAANGYWSPLTSWLLVPLTWVLPMNDMDVFRLMNLGLAFGCLHFVRKIIQTLVASKPLAAWASCAVAVILPFWALFYLTSDMLFLTVLTGYLWLHISGKFYHHPFLIAICGILLYFAKAYGLFFFLAHSLFMIWLLPREHRKAGFVKFSKALLIFLPVCALWVLLISNRYGHFTLSESARYNSAISVARPLVHPCDTMGLIPPLPGYQYSAWEDITRHIDVQKPERLNPLFQQTMNNTGTLITLMNKTPRYGLWLVIGLLIITGIFLKQVSKKIFLLAGTLVLFSGGYLLLFVEERYLLFPVIVLYLMAVALSAQTAKLVRSQWLRWLIYILPLYILIRPAVDIYRNTDTREEDGVYEIARHLKAINNQQNVAFASFNPYQAAPLAWHNQWKDYGGLSGYGNDTARMRKDIERHHIQFIVLPLKQWLPQNLSGMFEPVYVNKNNPFAVYGRIPAATGIKP